MNIVEALKDVVDALSHKESVKGVLTIAECIELIDGCIIELGG